MRAVVLTRHGGPARVSSGMHIRSVAILLLKLWGLYSLVNGAFGIVHALLPLVSGISSADPMSRYVLLNSGLGAILNLVLGTFLLLAPERIVDLILPEPESGVDSAGAAPPRYELHELQALLFGAAGAYLAILALGDIGQLVYAIARQPPWDQGGQFAFTLQQQQEELAGAAVHLVFAVVLLANRRALAGVWSRVHPMKT